MYSMKEACEKTGLSYETLKFYCNEGLIPNVQRDKNNRRLFDDGTIFWINNLRCLKNCGMSLQEMKNYISLFLEGNATIPRRKEILEEKRRELVEQTEKIHRCIEYIDWKQSLYDEMINQQTEEQP